MSTIAPPQRPWRSIGAVGAGFALTAGLSLGTDVVLHAVRVFPPWGQPMANALFVLATAYRVAYTVLGGYLTARLAPARPMKHALVLGAIGLAVSAVGAAASWRQGPDLGPIWYPVLLVVTALPSVWFGAVLFEIRPAQRGV